MTSGTKSSAGDSDKTRKPARLNETEFLRQEADAARQAISATIEEMRATLKDAGDLSVWAKRYPWASMGVATAAGFLAAAAFVPKRRHSSDDEPEFLRRVLADEQIAERVKQIAEESPDHRRGGGGLVQSVAMSLLRTFGPALQTAVTSALAAKAVAPDAEDIAAAANGVDPSGNAI